MSIEKTNGHLDQNEAQNETPENKLITETKNKVETTLNLNKLSEFWLQIRKEKLFETDEINPDGAIEDIIKLMKEYLYDIHNTSFLKEYSKLAKGNTCENLGNNGFNVYSEILRRLGVEISDEELKNQY